MIHEQVTEELYEPSSISVRISDFRDLDEGQTGFCLFLSERGTLQIVTSILIYRTPLKSHVVLPPTPLVRVK